MNFKIDFFTTDNEKGFVLPTALIFLAILALIGTTAVVVTTTDIKIGGNYKTGVQAFYNAEAGLQDGFARLVNSTVSDTGSETDADWNSANTYATTGYNNSFTIQHHAINGAVVTSSGKPLYKIRATGTSSSSVKTLEAIVALKYSSAFTNALHGCDGVAMSSNASTDSYSSSGGPSTGNNGSIGTSNANANVVIDSNTNIQGDVQATGSLTLNGNAQIGRDAESNNGISLNGQNIVGGNANTNGNIFLDQSTIQGNAKADGNIDLDHNSSRVVGTATAGGSIECKSNCTTQTGGVSANTDPNLASPVVPLTPCDPLGLSGLFDTADDIATSNNNNEIDNLESNIPYDTSTDAFALGGNSTFSLGGSGDSKDYHFSSFAIGSNASVTIQGDVTLYVDGNFSLASNTYITFAAGASLKIYVTGSFALGSNTSINNLGTPADLQIYSSAVSSSNSDYMVNLNSNSGFYGIVYAPNAAVSVSSNSAAHGAVRGKYVSMNSNGAFHYDEDLQNLSGGGTPEGYTLVSWREVY